MKAMRQHWRFNRAQGQYLWIQIWQGFTRHQRGALLGKTWLIIQPLALITVYTLVFSEVMQARLGSLQGPYAYSLFLCAALLPWQFFTEVVQRTQQSLIDHAHVIRKTAVPLGVFFLIPLGVASLNFLVMLGLFMAWAHWGAQVSWGQIVGLLPWVFLQIILAWVWGIALAIAHVFYRDVGQLLALILQFGFWMTPIVYPLNAIPVAIQNLIVMINPLLPMVLHEQAIVLGQPTPLVSWWAYGVFLIIGLFLAWRLLRQQAWEVVDVL